VQDVIVPHQPAKPAAHRRQPRVLRAERERLSVRLAVVVEISLVTFEDGARHFHRMLDPALLGPADKIGDGPTRMVGSVLGVVVDQQPFQMFFHELAQRRVRLQVRMTTFADAGHHFTAACPASSWPFGFSAPFGLPTTTM